MQRVLVSACLLGEAVRHDGRDKLCADPLLQLWVQQGRVVPVCPEVAGGLPVPRAPAEIAEAAHGADVLAGAAKVVDAAGRDVSAHFVQGADHALALARRHGIRIAILKEGSPSCGTGFTYDGTFRGVKMPNPGVTAARLRAAAVHVFSELQLAAAAELLDRLERHARD